MTAALHLDPLPRGQPPKLSARCDGLTSLGPWLQCHSDCPAGFCNSHASTPSTLLQIQFIVIRPARALLFSVISFSKFIFFPQGQLHESGPSYVVFVGLVSVPRTMRDT